MLQDRAWSAALAAPATPHAVAVETSVNADKYLCCKPAHADAGLKLCDQKERRLKSVGVSPLTLVYESGRGSAHLGTRYASHKPCG